MKTVALFLYAAVLYAHAISDDEIRRQWQEFQETYQKSYKSPVETQKRFAIFKKHLEEIAEHNKLYEEGKVTWREGVNKFSDWTEEERKEYLSHGILVGTSFSDDAEIAKQWADFQKTYKKSYRSTVEAGKRFEIFKKNVIKIEGLASDKENINRFTDWTEGEFQNYISHGLLPEDHTVKGNADEEIQRRWADFQKKYGKTYSSDEEAQKRFEIFKDNVKKIDEHNALFDQGKTTFRMGINEFCDWTLEEYLEWLKSH